METMDFFVGYFFGVFTVLALHWIFIRILEYKDKIKDKVSKW